MDYIVDRTFGIRYESAKFLIRDQVIKIQGDNIEIDEEYMSIPGLWALITERDPKECSSEDYEQYKELLYNTNVLYRDNWTTILRPIWEDFQREGIVSDDGEREYYSTIIGDGLYRTYFQKNGHCFDVYRDGNGLHYEPRLMLAGASWF